MAKKRYNPGKIASKSLKVEVLVSQEMPRIDAIGQVRINKQTYYRWRKQIGGMGI